MDQANTSFQQSTTSPSRETIPTEFFFPIILTWWYFKTLVMVIFRPGLFVAKRDSHPDNTLAPGPFFLLSVVGFFLLALYFPIMSEPVPTRSLLKSMEAVPVLLNISIYKVIGMHAIYLVVFIVSVSVVLGMCSGQNGREFLTNAGLACYFIVDIMAAVVFKFLLGSIIITGLLRVNLFVSWTDKRFLTVRWIDWFISILFFLSVLGYAYYLFKEREVAGKKNAGYVFVIFVVLLGVVSLNGYYFKKKIASRSKTEWLPERTSIGESTASVTTVDSTSVTKAVKVPTTADSANIPYNKTIIISSGNINPTIQFVGHRSRGRYWIDAKFMVRNTTPVPIYFPFNRLAKVYLSLGTESLLNRMYLGDKQFPFEIVYGKNEVLQLGANDSMQVRIRYDINYSMYKYLKDHYRIGLLKDHKVFIEMMMLNKETAFPVNKQGVWDMYFH